MTKRRTKDDPKKTQRKPKDDPNKTLEHLISTLASGMNLKNDIFADK